MISTLTTHWSHHLGCTPHQLTDGAQHIVVRPSAAYEPSSPWPLRRASVCLFTRGCGWVLSLPEPLIHTARSLCLNHPFEALVEEGDRRSQAWFDRGETNDARGPDRGDESYRTMNRLTAALDLHGWSHYIHWYCDPATWTAEPDPSVRPITPSDPATWAQWQAWPGPMVGPKIADYYEIADAFGYIRNGTLVSAAQLEASRYDLAWEYGIDTLPQHRGKGFATTLLKTLTTHIIRQNRIPWHYCDHYNRPSRRLPEKLGYLRYAEGLFSAT